MKKENTYTVYTTLFKRFGLHQLVNPNSPKMFGYNKYVLIHICLITFIITCLVIGLSGFVYDFKEPKNKFNITIIDMELFCILDFIFLGIFKMIMIFLNRNKIFKLFLITNDSFLLSKKYKEYYDKQTFGRHKRTLRWYFGFICISMLTWITPPIVLNIIHFFDMKQKTQIQKIYIFNLKYPFNNETCNSYYTIFFLIESIIAIYALYSIILFDIFMFAMLQFIAEYYAIVSYSFERFDLKFKNENGEFIIEMKRTLIFKK